MTEIDNTMQQLHQALTTMTVASCTCMTKTPDVEFHDAACRYRRTVEAKNIADSLKTQVDSLQLELTAMRQYLRKQAGAYIDNQKSIAEVYNLAPGQLQYEWRQGRRTDKRETAHAVIDALAMGGIHAHPGDGVACVTQMIWHWMDRAESAEKRAANVDRLVAALQPFADAADLFDDDQDGNGFAGAWITTRKDDKKLIPRIKHLRAARTAVEETNK